jgi:hypothetical protein
LQRRMLSFAPRGFGLQARDQPESVNEFLHGRLFNRDRPKSISVIIQDHRASNANRCHHHTIRPSSSPSRRASLLAGPPPRPGCRPGYGSSHNGRFGDRIGRQPLFGIDQAFSSKEKRERPDLQPPRPPLDANLRIDARLPRGKAEIWTLPCMTPSISPLSVDRLSSLTVALGMRSMPTHMVAAFGLAVPVAWSGGC